MEKVRWGLMGCGDISRRRVAPALNALESCELLAVARADASLAEPFAREFGAKRWFADWHDLLADSEIDAVYIATPVYLHAEQTIAAARAGKHVLCEKPMAFNARDCDRMIEACAANQVALGVAYYRHFYPLIARIKEILRSGEIGEPALVEIHALGWFDRAPGEPRSWLLEKSKAGGGPMIDFGCHRIEVLQHLFGEITDIQSRTLNVCFDREVEDTAYASLVFNGRTHAIVRVTHATYESRDTLDIYGTRGTIQVPVLNKGTLFIRTEKGERTEIHPPHENLHLPLIEDFTNAVLRKERPTVDGAVGREVTAVIDTIYRQ